MSPLPCWLGGAQNACLNFSDVDVAVQLHFALFRGSSGFVLKPSGMRFVPYGRKSGEGSHRNASGPFVRCGPTSGEGSPVRGSSGPFVRYDPTSGEGSSVRASSGPFKHMTIAASWMSDESGSRASIASEDARLQAQDDDYWPPPRDSLDCISVEILSIHNLPKVLSTPTALFPLFPCA